MSTARGTDSPTQRVRAEVTAEELLHAARTLFALDGYAAASLNAVCERAGVTKGALYHHFVNKRDLFLAVYEREQRRVAKAVVRAYLSEPDPWTAVWVGSRVFLERCLDPQVQRITLLDAPGALGYEAMREVGATSLDMLVAGIQRAIDEGRIAPRDPRPLAHLLYGALCESAMSVARAEDPAAALDSAQRELRALFDSIAATRPAVAPQTPGDDATAGG